MSKKGKSKGSRKGKKGGGAFVGGDEPGEYALFSAVIGNNGYGDLSGVEKYIRKHPELDINSRCPANDTCPQATGARWRQKRTCDVGRCGSRAVPPGSCFLLPECVERRGGGGGEREIRASHPRAGDSAGEQRGFWLARCEFSGFCGWAS